MPGSTTCSSNGVSTCDSKGAWGTPATCTNQTDNSGAPGTRLTSILQVPISAGLSTGIPEPNAQVTAGKTYWVGGVCDNTPLHVELYQKDIPAQTVY